MINDPCFLLDPTVVRTFLRVTVLTFTFISGVFLVKGSIGLSVQDIARLAKSYSGGTPFLAENLSRSLIDARIGAGYLFAAFTLQLVDLFKENTIGDIDMNPVGVMASVVASVVFFLVSLWLGRFFGERHARVVKEILQETQP